MQVFEAASSVRTRAIAQTYVEAAMQVNVQCGPGFVNQSLAAATVTSGVGRAHGHIGGGAWGTLGLIWILILGLLL